MHNPNTAQLLYTQSPNYKAHLKNLYMKQYKTHRMSGSLIMMLVHDDEISSRIPNMKGSVVENGARGPVKGKYHPFWKLTAQISFGLHLLVKGVAKSETEVLRILQSHVDEVDGFISRTTEDFLIIQIDLRTRIQYLSLPLQNLDIFDEMLEDRSFRLDMLQYNEKIEHAVERFTAAVNDSLKDIEKGKKAISGLWHFLEQSAKENAPLSNSLAAIYNSMLANTEGWNTTFSKVRRKGVALQSALTQLGGAVAEMQRRVGVASRRRVTMTSSPLPRVKSLRGRLFERESMVGGSSGSPAIEKPLPCDPAFPFLKTAHSFPPRSRNPHRMAQKSVPNLRVVKEFDELGTHEPPSNRAKSVTGHINAFDSNTFIPKLQRNLTRRLSKAKLTVKRSVEELTETIPTRPSTAASRVLRSARKNRQELQCHPSGTLPSRHPERPHTSNTLLARRETMKNQLMHYIKSDKVHDVWDSMVQKEKRLDRPASQCRKDGLWSKFHSKSSSMPSDDMQMSLAQEDLQRQMTWLREETKALNTYSLKPKHDAAPKLHIFSFQMSYHRELDNKESRYTRAGYSEAIAADAQSIITALPALPAPKITNCLSDTMEGYYISHARGDTAASPPPPQHIQQENT